jgi:hypothetical protein
MDPKSKMSYSLSNEDINEITGVNSPMITYPQLQQFNSIGDIFKKLKSDHFILLYTTSQNFGHWCCCFKLPNGDIEFYDSYGGEPDSRLKYMKDYYNKYETETGNVYYPHLSYLLLKTPKNVKIHFSPYQHQELAPGISTCGRHVGWRLLHRFLDIDTYSQFFGRHYIDKIITKLTNHFIL